uniref:Hydroxyacid oxidase 1 n=1 Tax=Equus caballus TaxID=9796 RepID=F6QEA9_HORSE
MFTRLVCINDYEQHAKSVLRKSIYDYYRSGANDEETLADNVAAFSRWKLYPRMLRNVAEVDLSTSVLGQTVSMPICVGATAMQCMAHVDGELATVRGDDAREAVKHGLDGILVSNHGARQLDGVPATGEKGVQDVLEILKEEFRLAMALSGCQNVKVIDKTLVRKNPLAVSKI